MSVIAKYFCSMLLVVMVMDVSPARCAENTDYNENLQESVKFYNSGDYESAARALEPIEANMRKDYIQIKTIYMRALQAKGLAYYKLARYQDALADLVIFVGESSTTNNKLTEYKVIIADCYQKLGDADNAIKYLEYAYGDLGEDDNFRSSIEYSMASIYALQLNNDQAIKWLNKISWKNNRCLIDSLKVDKDFDSLRKEDNFQEILKKSSEYLNESKCDKPLKLE